MQNEYVFVISDDETIISFIETLLEKNNGCISFNILKEKLQQRFNFSPIEIATEQEMQEEDISLFFPQYYRLRDGNIVK